MLLNHHWITEELKGEIKKYLEENENIKIMIQNLSSSKREVYSNTVLPQETRKISNKKPNLTPHTTRERRTN